MDPGQQLLAHVTQHIKSMETGQKNRCARGSMRVPKIDRQIAKWLAWEEWIKKALTSEEVYCEEEYAR